MSTYVCPAMPKLAQVLVLVALLAMALAAPAVHADRTYPRQLHTSACSSVKVAERGHVLFRQGVSCAYAKRWARRLAATRGAARPRGFRCTSGSKFRSGGYCERGSKHFGWQRWD